MSTETIAALLGAIVGSVLTFVLGQIAGSRQEKRQQRLRLLGALMAGRGKIFSPEVAEAVNLIPIVFHDNEKVRRAYQHFCATIGIPHADFVKRYVELIIEVSKSLGYSDRLTEADIHTGLFLQAPAEPQNE
jgi:hypothetical protein